MSLVKNGRRGHRQRPEALRRAWTCLSSGRHTTASLARALGVSTATAFRAVKALRRQGHVIESVKRDREWYFEVRDEAALEAAWRSDPLLGLVGFLKGTPRNLARSIDETLFGRK